MAGEEDLAYSCVTRRSGASETSRGLRGQAGGGLEEGGHDGGERSCWPGVKDTRVQLKRGSASSGTTRCCRALPVSAVAPVGVLGKESRRASQCKSMQTTTGIKSRQ